MSKATHSGSCQICGRVQKLPGNVLSLHGYTTRWGFFEGTCPGSKHSPFETSCALIKTYRDNAVVNAAMSRELAAAHLQGEGRLEAEQRVKEGRYGVTRILRAVTLSPVETVYQSGWVGHSSLLTFPDGSTESDRDTVEGKAKSLHASSARRASQRAAQLEEYAAWQTERLQNWKPGTLIPVQSEEEAQSEALKVGDKIRIGGAKGDVATVTEIRTQVCRGCGPHLNGQHLPHAVYVYENGRSNAMPVRSIRKASIIR